MRLKIICLKSLFWNSLVSVGGHDEFEKDVLMVFICLLCDAIKVQTKPEVSDFGSSGRWNPVKMETNTTLSSALIQVHKQSLPVTAEHPKHHLVEFLYSCRSNVSLFLIFNK